jgi:hypothetical protein
VGYSLLENPTLPWISPIPTTGCCSHQPITETHPSIKAILSKWTIKNNLTVTFSKESLDKDIDNAATSILHILFPKPRPSYLLQGHYLVQDSIPTNTLPGIQTNPDDENSMIVDKVTDPDALLKAVQDSHPLLKEATFIHRPDWTTASLPEDATHHNLRFTIEDPNSFIANNLIASEAIIFATTIRPRLWVDKTIPAPAANIEPPWQALPF